MVKNDKFPRELGFRWTPPRPSIRMRAPRDDGLQGATETVSVHGAADGLAFPRAHGPAGGSTAPAPTAGPATLLDDPPGARPAQRPADRRKQVSECSTPPIVTRAVCPRVAKPVAFARTALRALGPRAQHGDNARIYFRAVCGGMPCE